MSSNKIMQEIEGKSEIDERTGEMKRLVKGVPMHSESEFFVMYLRPWLDASENDVSRKIKVFIHCILSSSLSRGRNVATEGNYFNVSSVITSVRCEDKSITENNVRVCINRLCSEGFISKAKKLDADTGLYVEDRGRYYINPKFGIKGQITERTYLKLVIERAPIVKKKGGVNNV